MPFLHGVEVIEINYGPRPINVVRSSVISLIGTVPDTDVTIFTLNKPVLIAGRRAEAAPLGATGTLPAAIDDTFDQTGAVIVVVRVEPPDISGGAEPVLPSGIDIDTGTYQGISAFLASGSELGFTPRILIAPEFSQVPANTNELLTVAERLRATVIADGPNTNDAGAIAFRDSFGSDRLYIVDPWVRVFNSVDEVEEVRLASARVTGLIAKSDAENGFWWSPSNQELRGILGTARPIDFALGDPNARANLLNEKEVTTIIRKTGYRLWGNRTTSADPKWAFLSVRRTADIIHESVLQAHLWAVDRKITRTYLEGILESVNAFLRSLQARGAIINGRAWADPELNTPTEIASGRVHIDFDFTLPYPAKRITFRSRLVNDYLSEVLPTGTLCMN